MNLNVLLIGKSGAGKSKFGNYLFGTDVFESGVGKPVTGWESNFQSYHISSGKYNLTIFDTVGLEADNFTEWDRRMREFISEKHVDSNVIDNNLHGVFYVINAATSRVEEFELKLLSDFSNMAIPVNVILSNSDNADKKQIDAMRKALSSFAVSEVCSVTVNKRGGKKQSAYGKEEVLNIYFQQFNSIFFERAIKNIENEFFKVFDKVESETKLEIDSVVYRLFDSNNINAFQLVSRKSLENLEAICSKVEPIADFLNALGFYNAKVVLMNLIDNLKTKFSQLNNSFTGFLSVNTRIIFPVVGFIWDYLNFNKTKEAFIEQVYQFFVNLKVEIRQILSESKKYMAEKSCQLIVPANSSLGATYG